MEVMDDDIDNSDATEQALDWEHLVHPEVL